MCFDVKPTIIVGLSFLMKIALAKSEIKWKKKQKKTHSYKKSTEHLLNSFEMLDHSQFIIDLAILKSTNYSNAR